tara:strand:+ start:145 stop:354 length:210 start_codon:yes stop_codon:yes gene_type:complete
MEFLTENWIAILVGFMAFVKVIVNLTPTEKDNQVFGWIDTIINVIIGNRIKDKPEATKAEYVPKKKKKK